ncbi:MAG: DNA-directed RNA polymerase subunit B [Candidatus Aenigmatarchaeota archaeon]
MSQKKLRSVLLLHEKGYGWADFQINSFNKLMDSGLQEIINEIGSLNLTPETGELKLAFGEVTIGKPIIKEADGSTREIFPNEARIRNLTYAAPVFVEITPIINGVREKPEVVHICDFPIMVRSKYCLTSGLSEQELIAAGEDPKDCGGYFIINGTERAVILIEEIASNKPVYEWSKDVLTVRINSERSGFRQKHLIERKPDGILHISFANLRHLSLITIIRALGLASDREICEAISSDPKILNELYVSLYQEEATKPEEAMEIIGKKLKLAEDYRKQRVNQILDRYLLPHIGQEPENRIEKAYFLCKVINRLLHIALGLAPEDDIDHYANKRLLTAGDLLGQLFRSVLLGRWGLLAKMTYNYQKITKRGKIPSIQGIVEADAATKQILSSLATGNWVGGRTGVSQRLDRSSFIKTISHLRSAISPLTPTQEHFRARQIHPTEFGRICPAETPEGSSIGLRKHLAILAEITPGLNLEEETKLFKELQEGASEKEKTGADLFFNGRWIRTIKRPEEFVRKLRERRRQGLLSHHVNIAWFPDFNEIRINSDPGRLRRPLIIVENGKPRLTPEIMEQIQKGKMTFYDLIKKGVIEYVDAEEEENALVALRPDDVTKEHTHLEIDPITLFGNSAAITPYPEYNRGDRINFGSKMVGQAIGCILDNFPLRTDTKFNILAYPQKPVVQTSMSSIMNEYPGGQNIVIAIMCWDGWNLNDAIVMSQSAVERGLFRSFYFRTYETLKKRYWGGQEDEIVIPQVGIKGHRGEAAYVHLDEDGIINPEIEVQSDSVLIGKISPLRFLFGEEFTAELENKREASICVRHGEKGIVDAVLISETLDAEQLIKVRVRDMRIPEIGDKFASRHGQKGVISLLVKQDDLPFTADGTVPDIIFNPHAIPSRMTIGHLLEILAGKVGALSGQYIDGSVFSGMREEEIRKTMQNLGFRDDGKQMLYDGATGKAYPALIFTGISYYLKLDHMVTDKIHARSRGPVTLLTKQPTEGRAKRGGLRLGEMEQQCIVGHNSAMILKERFDSDAASIPICKSCGLLAIHDFSKNKTYCDVCKNSEVVWIQTSYAFKLFLDELKSIGIYPKIVVEEV